MKNSERAFLRKVLEHHGGPLRQNNTPRLDQIAHTEGIPDKQLEYWAHKWVQKGWWNYGVSLRTGWFTVEGFSDALNATQE